MTKKQLILHCLQIIPYPSQIRNLDIHEDKAIRFTWRGERFRITTSLNCESVADGMRIGTNSTILLRRLLQKS